MEDHQDQRIKCKKIIQEENLKNSRSYHALDQGGSHLLVDGRGLGVVQLKDRLNDEQLSGGCVLEDEKAELQPKQNCNDPTCPVNAHQSLTTIPAPMTSAPLFTVPTTRGRAN